MMERRQFLRNLGIAAGVGGAVLAGLITYPYLIARAKKELMISGSLAVSRYIALLAAPFIEKHPHVKIAIEGGGSVAGLVALDNGGIDLAMMSRDLNLEEFNLDLHSNLIGIEGIAIVTHPSMNINNVSMDQLDGIFEGTITNWKQLGGPHEKINVYSRNEGSSTRAFVEDVILKGAKFARDVKVFDSAIAMSDAIAKDPYGIGYLTNKNLNDQVKTVAINGVQISDKTLLLKLYPLSRDMFLVNKNSGSDVAKDFVRFSLSAEGQGVFVKHGLTQVSR
ncbi:phosphate ABC transporter substrate-binding protein [Polynucleobacter sp. JS-Polo-80-F4]|uniref:phosphate ABC transporter substrate-binding protein n=1 Tax=Polynucleobacter sp. JS-Polo-80-F4 TaxID=2576918 RepID=UPI001C0B00D1|nr:phosphate ABC transporter substrate-binding protein [Polynucleobacter sp. JS-Polo-80-F4]MBU3617579.1 phosphate ABC transporter substrate-binding protein [Polynucleobacter sp. JS-Polo-80-F4]